MKILKYRRGSQSPFGSIRSRTFFQSSNVSPFYHTNQRPLFANTTICSVLCCRYYLRTFTQGRPQLPQSCHIFLLFVIFCNILAPHPVLERLSVFFPISSRYAAYGTSNVILFVDSTACMTL